MGEDLTRVIAKYTAYVMGGVAFVAIIGGSVWQVWVWNLDLPYKISLTGFVAWLVSVLLWLSSWESL